MSVRLFVEKLRFSENVTKIDKISTLDGMYVKVKSKVEISSIFVAFLENLNFM